LGALQGGVRALCEVPDECLVVTLVRLSIFFSIPDATTAP
jgi:hypothetical protein